MVVLIPEHSGRVADYDGENTHRPTAKQQHARQDLNLRPSGSKPDILSAELRAHEMPFYLMLRRMIVASEVLPDELDGRVHRVVIHIHVSDVGELYFADLPCSVALVDMAEDTELGKRHLKS